MTATRFGQHWRKLACGFRDEHHDVGGMLLRQEDIATGEVDFDQIERYLEISINPDLLTQSVGSHRRADDSVPAYETRMLAKEVENVAATLGYGR